jgi:hypothetical protein
MMIFLYCGAEVALSYDVPTDRESAGGNERGEAVMTRIWFLLLRSSSQKRLIFEGHVQVFTEC